MRNHIYRPAMFAFYDRTRIEKKLEAMAEKGWIIEQVGAPFWKYRKSEPKKLHVSVVYVADASVYDPSSTPSQDLLEDLSAENGWKLEVSWGQMQIFYNEQEKPIPLETDPVTQVEAIHRAMKKNGVRASYWNIAFSVWILVMLGIQFHLNPLGFLTSVSIWLIPDCMIIAANALLDLGFWHFWYRKASAAAEQGEFIELWNHRVLSWILSGLTILILVCMILSFRGRWAFAVLCFLPVTLTIVGVNGMRTAMQKAGVKKKTNFLVCLLTSVVLSITLLAGVCFVSIHYHLLDERKPVGSYEIYPGREIPVYADELPLRMEDLTDTTCQDWSLEREENASFLLSETTYHQWPLTDDPDVADMAYIITEPKFDFLYDFCKNEILSVNQDEVSDGTIWYVNHYEPIDPAPWDATEAYQLLNSTDAEHVIKRNDFILCYGDKIVELHMDDKQTLTEAQIKTIAEKLHP